MAQSIDGVARNHALFREVNERLNETRSPRFSFREFICECSDPSCTASLAVAAGEYETVRSNAKRFLVARGHEQAEVEQVVEDNGRFLIVEATVETALMAHVDRRAGG